MKQAHNIKLSVFAHDHEDPAKLAAALTSLCPFNLKDEKILIETTDVKGATDKTIIILEINLKKERHTKQVLNHIKQNLAQDQLDILKKQIESRFDDELHFFIRLDKPNLLEADKLLLTDTGNCFHIKILIAAFPANRENGLKVVKDWLQ